MRDESQSKLLKLSLANKKIAVAVLGQAILDEGGIGASGISIFYTSKEEALHLWKIADSLGYANPLRKKNTEIIITMDSESRRQKSANCMPELDPCQIL